MQKRYAKMHIQMYMMYVLVCVYIYVYMCVCVCVCVYIYIYVCMYVYTKPRETITKRTVGNISNRIQGIKHDKEVYFGCINTHTHIYIIFVTYIYMLTSTVLT